MTQPPVTTDGRPIVGAYGDVYTAPAGTAAPTDIETPGTPWLKLGLVSEDGATWTPPEEETEDIKAWQSPYPVRIVTTSLTSSVQFALMEWDRDTLPFALGGGTFTDDAIEGTTTYHPPGPGESESRAIFIKILDDPIKMGLYYPKGRIVERDDAVFKPDEAALLNVTFGIEGDINIAEPYNLIFDSATFPDAAAVFGAEGPAQQPAQEPAETPPQPEGFVPPGTPEAVAA